MYIHMDVNKGRLYTSMTLYVHTHMCESVSNGPNPPRVVVCVLVFPTHGCVSPSPMDQICHELLFVFVCLAHGCVSPSQMDQICHELLFVLVCFLLMDVCVHLEWTKSAMSCCLCLCVSYSWMCESVSNGPNLP